VNGEGLFPRRGEESREEKSTRDSTSKKKKKKKRRRRGMPRGVGLRSSHASDF
jgi:hypothetical protein